MRLGEGLLDAMRPDPALELDENSSRRAASDINISASPTSNRRCRSFSAACHDVVEVRRPARLIALRSPLYIVPK
jgi:hypothetical protein